MVVSAIGTLALAVAALITFGLGMATGFFTAPPLRGPDTMGYAMVFFGLAIRWGLVLIAVVICLSQGKFAGVSPKVGLAALIVIACHAGLGLVATASWAQWTATAKWYTVIAGNAGSVGLPLAVQGMLLAMLWGKAPEVNSAIWPRVIGWPAAVVAVVGLVGGVVVFVQSQVESARRQQAAMIREEQEQAENDRQNREREKRQADELAALPDDAPLDVFVTHLFIDKTEVHHAAAIERIGKLPGLGERLAASLRNPDPLKREYILNYIRMCPNPDAAWSGSVAGALSALAQDIREAPALYDATTQRSFRGMVLGALLTARKFPQRDFGGEVAAIRSALLTKEEDDSRRAALELVDRFEAGRPLEEGE